MKRVVAVLASVSVSVASLSAQRAWQQITVPTVEEAAANFPTPPREYGAIRWLTHGGEVTRERIVAELDQCLADGIYVVTLGWGNFLQPAYLSTEQLALAQFAVAEAARRGMKVWIQDEGNYPSGMAGGLIDKEYPQLRMQGIVADIRVSVVAGQTLTLPLPPGTLGAFSVNGSDQSTALIPLPAEGDFTWTAPSEGSDPNRPNWSWTVVFVRHIFRSSPTRASNRADGLNVKDARYSLIDYLDPEATRAFLATTHEKYRALFGDEFGRTVLGFFGDETDYNGFLPWTPRLLEAFAQQKGYDLKPYLPMFFMGALSSETQRVKADYYDVWSRLFEENFFAVQAEWAVRHQVEDLRHVGADSVPLVLIRYNGDYFRNLRHAQVPGIDNINEIGPGMAANFPKLASSAAHLFGRPRAWEEEGGGTGELGKFVTDFHFARGVTALQLRGRRGGGRGDAAGPSADPRTIAMSWYVNRLGYLLSVGRPAAQVALYYPSNSVWMGDEESLTATLHLTQQLLEHQIDFDYIDEQVLGTLGKLEDGGLKNLSGQVYRGIIIPPSTVITRAALDRLRDFAAHGGRVVFVGRTPSLVVGRTFRDADEAAPDLDFAVREPAPEITLRVVEALPPPDVRLDRPCPPLTYNHRHLRDGDVYFLFNESGEWQSRRVTLTGRGTPQLWDPGTGGMHPIADATTGDGTATLPLSFGPYEARLVVLGPRPAEAGAVVAVRPAEKILLELAGGWSLALGEQQLTTALQSWEELGSARFAGTAHYRREFTLPSIDGPVFLECDDVRDHATVQLNGVDLGSCAWQPYRWEISGALKAGSNVLEIDVLGPNGDGAARGGAISTPTTGTGTAGVWQPRYLPGPVVSGLLPGVRLTTFRNGSSP